MTLIYDNGCNLHQYCLNREPGFFYGDKVLCGQIPLEKSHGLAKFFILNYCFHLHIAFYRMQLGIQHRLVSSAEINYQSSSRAV